MCGFCFYSWLPAALLFLIFIVYNDHPSANGSSLHHHHRRHITTTPPTAPKKRLKGHKRHSSSRTLFRLLQYNYYYYSCNSAARLLHHQSHPAPTTIPIIIDILDFWLFKLLEEELSDQVRSPPPPLYSSITGNIALPVHYWNCESTQWPVWIMRSRVSHCPRQGSIQ